MIFELVVAEDKVKPQQVTGLHLLCAIIFLVTGGFLYWLLIDFPWVGIGLVLLGIGLFVLTLAKNKWVTGPANIGFRAVELVILLALAAFTVSRHLMVPSAMFLVVSAAVLFAFYWERAGNNQLLIQVDETGVKPPVTSRRRFIDWADVETVVLRYGILTINCVENRLYQWAVREQEFDEQIFDAYCTAMVEKNMERRRKDDW